MVAVLAFVPAFLSGILLVHMVWPDWHLRSLILKGFLGIGVGLGVQSLLYFLYLLVLPGRNVFSFVNASVTLCLLVLAALLHRRQAGVTSPGTTLPKWSRVQQVLVALSGAVFIVSLLATANYLLRRRQGDWDAWMMYNRAARFVYFDQAHWRESFSPQMDPIFHPDYPLLLAMNIVAGWEMLGRDASAVPMLQSALFALATVGLLGTALATTKSAGQAAVGVIALWGIPVFVNEGARQMADVPLAFYFLATGILFLLYARRAHPGLLALAGLTSGFAAWTKNEGSVVIVGALASVIIVYSRRGFWRTVLPFLAGLAAPLAVVLYFKLLLAPPGDILRGAAGGLLTKVLDLSRHGLILRDAWTEVTTFGGWDILPAGLGILPILALYYVLFRAPVDPLDRPGYIAGIAMLMIQLLGYYAAYLVSPYDLAWHLSYSSTRIVVQIFPLLLFLTLCACLDVERALQFGAGEGNGVENAAHN